MLEVLRDNRTNKKEHAYILVTKNILEHTSKQKIQ